MADTDEILLTLDAHRVAVRPLGATLARYDVAGVSVLDGVPPGAAVDGSRGQVLAPWPNRVGDGTWSWRGERLQLALTEAEAHNAIHGLVRTEPWEVATRDASSVRLELALGARPGWPFPLHCTQTYALTGAGLTATTTVGNDGTGQAPVALGAHPYLSPGPGLVDACTLTLPARTVVPAGERGLPLAPRPVAGSDHDFRGGRQIGDARLDDCWTDLEPGPDGAVVVGLDRPDGHRVELRAACRYLQVFTGDVLPARRREGLAVEPMTAPPDALRTGTDLVMLAPGETTTLSWSVRLVRGGS